MSEPAAPTPDEQVAFLGQIERLLSEGQFVATYKYALLVSIADLAVQLGRDDGSVFAGATAETSTLTGVEATATLYGPPGICTRSWNVPS